MSQCRTDAASRLAHGRGAISFVLLILAAPLLAACTTAQLDALPKEIGGLPEGAPKRLDNPPPFPAVHDMPPARSQALMDKDEQTRLQSDLVAARTKLQTQQNQAKQAAKPQAKPAAKAAAQAQKPAATVKRSKRPTALSDDNSGASGRAPANSARQAPSAPAAANNASEAAWPTPPAAR